MANASGQNKRGLIYFQFVNNIYVYYFPLPLGSNSFQYFTFYLFIISLFGQIELVPTNLPTLPTVRQAQAGQNRFKQLRFFHSQKLTLSYDYNFLLRPYGTRIIIIPLCENDFSCSFHHLTILPTKKEDFTLKLGSKTLYLKNQCARLGIILE